MGVPQAGFLLKYFSTHKTDPITIEHHLGWQDLDPPTGSPLDLGYGPPIAPTGHYYFGPWSPGTEAEARIAETFGDRITDMRLGYFKFLVTPGKDGDTGVGGDRCTRIKTGERYLAVRILDHLASGKITRVLFMREKT